MQLFKWLVNKNKNLKSNLIGLKKIQLTYFIASVHFYLLFL